MMTWTSPQALKACLAVVLLGLLCLVVVYRRRR
jgi:hypothetical protein